MRKLVMGGVCASVLAVLAWHAIPFVAFGIAVVQSTDEPLMKSRPTVPLYSVARVNKQDMPLAFVRWPESGALSGPLAVWQAQAEIQQSDAVHAELLLEGSLEFYKAQALIAHANSASKEAFAKPR